MALAEAQLGNWEKAEQNLRRALDYKTEAKLGVLEKAQQAVLVSVHSWKIRVSLHNLKIWQVPQFG